MNAYKKETDFVIFRNQIFKIISCNLKLKVMESAVKRMTMNLRAVTHQIIITKIP